METTFHVYQPGDDKPETRTVDLPKDPGFHKLADLLNPIIGGDLEHVTVLVVGVAVVFTRQVWF